MLFGVFDRRLLQQPHGRELDARLGLALEQVQHERHRRGNHARQEERRQKGQHGYSDLALADRYDSSAISSGSRVLSSW